MTRQVYWGGLAQACLRPRVPIHQGSWKRAKKKSLVSELPGPAPEWFFLEFCLQFFRRVVY